MTEQKLFRATIEVLIRAGCEAEASDAMSALLTETAMHDKDIVTDWAYSHHPVEIDVPEALQGREEYFADGNVRKGLPEDPTLENGDYIAPNGIWLTVRDAAISVLPKDDLLRISVYDARDPEVFIDEVVVRWGQFSDRDETISDEKGE